MENRLYVKCRKFSSCKVNVWFKRKVFSLFSILKRICRKEYVLSKIYLTECIRLYRSILKYIHIFAAHRGVIMDKSEIKKESVESSVSEFDNVDPEYRKLVDLASDKDLNFDISNSSLSHAKYLVFKIIQKAQKELNIFIRSSDTKIFSDDSIKINNPNLNVKIMVEEYSKNTGDFFKKLFFNCKLDIQPLTKIDKNTPYFIVSDNKRFRIEFKEDEYKGIANFNRPEIAEILNQVFVSNWKSD